MARKHVVVDARGMLTCLNCGEAIASPAGDVDWYLGVIRAFEKVHKGCRPGDPNLKRCCFATDPVIVSGPELQSLGLRAVDGLDTDLQGAGPGNDQPVGSGP